ncbi:MAG TPA: hypothetical protein VNU75_07585 [Acidimicrobiales bacterium]|nr:hypothetical protein [Acidimicrobiales bacterium]
MSLQHRRRAAAGRLRGIVLVAFSFFAVLAASGGSAAAASDLPLPSAIETPADSWVVLPMGQTGSLVNTFWQLLRAAPGSSQWSVVTPQGVADNGGLVAAAGVTTASTTVGFLPSQSLRFSPLSVTTDAGRTWSPAFLPGALAARPDALASGPGRSLAIVGSAVLQQPSNSPSWSRLVTLAALQRLAPQCAATALDAVAMTPTGAILVGAACHGHLGLFSASGGKWRLDGAPLPGEWRDASTTILRLQASNTQTTAVATATKGSHHALFALSQSRSGGWHASAPLPIGAGATVLASAVDFGGALSVLVGSKESESVDQITPAGSWVTLPAPPRGAVGLAWVVPATTSFGATTLDAFTVVGGTDLHVFALTPGGGKWAGAQTLQVPLPYGSSS